jgi:opacity protein-like surface antigen
MRRILLIAGLALLVATPALAQDRPVNFLIGGGVTFPTGDVADSFDMGGQFIAGLAFNFNDNIGFETDYQFHFMGGPERTFAQNIGGASPVLIESNHQIHMGTFNIVVRTPSTSPVAAYFLAGPGVYNRKVELTTPAVGIITVCDPYWYVCFPTPVSTDQIIGDRSSTDFGLNFGGGISFGGGARFFVEARYHMVFGDDITVPGGTTRSTDAQYFPITFGLRF